MRVVGHSVAALAARIGNTSFAVLTSLLIARALGPAGNGQYTLLVLLHGVAATFATFGLPAANTFLVGKGKYTPREVIGNAAASALGLGILFAAVALLAVMLLKGSVFAPVPWPLAIAAVALLPFAVLTQFIGGVLLGAGRVQLLSALAVVASGSMFVAVLGLNLFGALTLGHVVAAWVSSIALAAVTAVVATERGLRLPVRFNRRLFIESIRFGVPAYLANVVSFFNFRVDVFLVGGFLGPAAVGYYGVALSVGEICWYASSALTTALYPRITAETPSAAVDLVGRGSRHVLVLTAATAFALWAVRPLLPIVLGPRYAPVPALLTVLLPGMFAYAFAPLWSAYFTGQLGRPSFSFWIALLCVALDVCLNVVLLPRVGVIGAAWASTISYGVAIAVAFVFLQKASGLRWRDAFWLTRSDVNEYRALLRRVWAPSAIRVSQ